MANQYKASLYNYFFNSINAILIIVNGIVMVPVYFHYMSVSTYGAWLATGNVVAMLGLLEGGFSFVITQKLSEAISRNNWERFQILSGSNILSALFISITILILGLCVAPFIADWVNVDVEVSSDIRIAFILSLLATCISIFVNLFGAFPQVWQDTKKVGIFNTIANISAIVVLILLLFWGLGVISIALSYVVRSTLTLVLNGSWIVKNWKIKKCPRPLFSLRDTALLTRDCAYPLLSKVAGTIVGNSQSFIIAHFLNPGLAAIYDLTSKICMVACGFVSQMNGSFFALFSLTLAEGNKEKTDKVMYNTTMFYVTLLGCTVLYSICFTEPIIHYWVGLDKFGGTWLLILLVLAKIVAQMRTYFNSILYTGGLINLSAKWDILWMMTYIFILLAIVNNTQIYAVPIATLVSCLIFIWVYLRLMKTKLFLDIRMIIYVSLRIFALIIPYAILHFTLAPDYHNIYCYILYILAFSICFMATLFSTNKTFFKQVLSKIKKS